MEQKIDKLNKNICQHWCWSTMRTGQIICLCALIMERKNKKKNRWEGKFWTADISARNNIVEASESADSKQNGRARTIR